MEEINYFIRKENSNMEKKNDEICDFRLRITKKSSLVPNEQGPEKRKDKGVARVSRKKFLF